MDKEQLETNIAALELLVNETADKSIDFRAQLEQAKKQLEDINKPELTPMQFDSIQEVIENAVNDFDFEDTDNYHIEYELDYDSRVNAQSLELQSSSELIEKIVEKVAVLFKEVKEEPTAEQINKTTTDNS